MDQPSTEQLRSELRRLYDEWFAAIPAHDNDFFIRHLAEDWHYTNVLGVVRGKQDYLTYIAPVSGDAQANRLLELTVRPYGPIVLVHGRYAVPAEFAPPAGADTQFTAVWLHEGDTWTALAHHATTAASS